MKIHSDVITRATASEAMAYTGLQANGVFIDLWELSGSRSRRLAYKFRLAAWSSDRRGPKRRRNTGHYGAEDAFYPASVFAATWDEHGDWFAALFDVDPDAIIGTYRGRDDFHAKTAGRYRDWRVRPSKFGWSLHHCGDLVASSDSPADLYITRDAYA